jgi:multidrug efflux system membrane fusion protein
MDGRVDKNVMLKSIEEDGDRKRSDVAFHTPDADRPRTRRVILVGKLLLQTLLAGAILFGAYKGMQQLILTKAEVPTRQAREIVYTVETAPVEIRDHAPTLNLYGEIRAARTADLRALVAGEIIRVNPDLEAGATLDAGAELVEIDPFQYRGAVTEARANLTEARAGLVEARGRVATEEGNVERALEQLAFAERDVDRASQLRESGAVTERTLDERSLIVSQRKQAVDQRRNALAVERARVDQQQAAIERLEWRLAQAEKNLSDTVLKAPFDAVVREENAAVGRLVNVNDVIAALYDRNALEVRLTLSDNQYGRILADGGKVIGRPVEVLWYIGGEPVRYEGEIVRVGADVALARGGIDAFASVRVTPDQPALRPGAFVEVRVADRTYENSARIPEAALYGTDHVYVMEEGRTVRREVRPVAFDGTHLIVEGDLASGDTLIVTRLDEAGEGVRVAEPKQAAPAAASGETAPAAPGGASEGTR